MAFIHHNTDEEKAIDIIFSIILKYVDGKSELVKKITVTGDGLIKEIILWSNELVIVKEKIYGREKSLSTNEIKEIENNIDRLSVHLEEIKELAEDFLTILKNHDLEGRL